MIQCFIMSVSLCAIAEIIKKDQRTVRRWCEKDFVPGAYRTRGGHWRIRRGVLPSSYVEKARTWASRSRDARREFVNAWIEFFVDRLRERLPKGFARGRGRVAIPEAMIATASRTPLMAVPIHEIVALKFHYAANRGEVASEPGSKQDFNRFLAAGVTVADPRARTAAEKSPKKVALHTAAVELRLTGEDPTHARLAGRMGISRTTFWRWFTKAEIETAIQAAGDVTLPQIPKSSRPWLEGEPRTKR
jgi:predicted DNA-binding protein (UPF0251 family)